MAKTKPDHAARIEPHMQSIVDGIHETLKAAGVKDIRVHAIQFKATRRASAKPPSLQGCVRLPDGTVICG